MELLKPLLLLPSSAQRGAHPLPSPPPTAPVFPLGVVRDIQTGHIAGDLSIFPDTSPPPATVPDSAGDGDIPATPGPSWNLEAGRGGTPHRWEVAYNVDERYRGRGLAVAMLKAVITGWCVWVGMETLIAVSREGPRHYFDVYLEVAGRLTPIVHHHHLSSAIHGLSSIAHHHRPSPSSIVHPLVHVVPRGEPLTTPITQLARRDPQYRFPNRGPPMRLPIGRSRTARMARGQRWWHEGARFVGARPEAGWVGV